MSAGIGVVTGASRGIGRAIALAMCKAGYTVLGIGRDSAALAQTGILATSASGSFAPLAADLRDPDAGARVMAAAGGRISALIHAAGDLRAGEFRPEDAELLAQVNYLAPARLTAALLASLTEAQGDVVFINSTQALGAKGGFGPYAASKAALRAFADALREEAGPLGVRVTSIFPGSVATRMQDKVAEATGLARASSTLMQPDDIAEAVMAALLLPATAELTEMVLRPRRRPG